MSGESRQPIRVSELAEFVYCRQAWWLQMVEKEPSSVESHGEQAKRQQWHREQVAHIARMDAFSGAGYAALLYGEVAARNADPHAVESGMVCRGCWRGPGCTWL